jgi:hypothetical protein
MFRMLILYTAVSNEAGRYEEFERLYPANRRNSGSRRGGGGRVDVRRVSPEMLREAIIKLLPNGLNRIKYAIQFPSLIILI